MSRLCVFVLSAMMILSTDVFAQERGIELQAGGGYAYDSGEAPSVPAVNVGVVAWLTPTWGIGARITEGIGSDYYDAPHVDDFNTFLGKADLHIWTLTSQWRQRVGTFELNFGAGVGGLGFRNHWTVTGIPRGGGRIEPTPPQLVTDRSGVGFIALDLLVGRRLAGSIHLKGGFTYSLSDDARPFQPLLVFAWNID